MQAEDVDVDRRAGGESACGVADLLHHDRGLGDAHAGAAKFLGHRDAEPAALGDRFGEFMGKLMGPILLGPIAVVELVTERSDRVSNLLPLRRCGQRLEGFHATLPSSENCRFLTSDRRRISFGARAMYRNSEIVFAISHTRATGFAASSRSPRPHSHRDC